MHQSLRCRLNSRVFNTVLLTIIVGISKGANVFAGWDAPKKRKPRTRVDLEKAKFGEGKVFGTLQEQNRFHKFGRYEPTPNPDQLKFVDFNQQSNNKPVPATFADEPAEYAPPAAQSKSYVTPTTDLCTTSSTAASPAGEHRLDLTCETDMNAVTISEPLIEAPHYLESNDTMKQGNVVAAPRLTGKISNKSIGPTDTDTEGNIEPATAVMPVPSENNGQAWVGKPPMTCRRWKLTDDCPYSDADCPLQHCSLEQVEPPSGPPPKYLPHPQTCYFWYKYNSCHSRPGECNYAHWNTGLLGNPSKQGNPIPIPKSMASQPFEIPKSMKTCYFWKNSRCNKSESECEYAHFQCEQDAAAPWSISLCKCSANV